MKKLKINFKIDIISGENIPTDEIRKKISIFSNKKNKNFYLSEIADFYYKKKYNKNIIQILDKYYNIPRCPATNEFVSYKLAGSIIFGKYSKIKNSKEINKHISKNNKNFKEFIKKIKEERKGKGNPMYGATPWNKNLNKNIDDRVKLISKKLTGKKVNDETKKKQSISAKKRKVHGHTGFKHSEKSKQLMREKTIKRFKNGGFPQTNSLPHLKVKEILLELFSDNFSEEYIYGNFVFDFKVNNNLIEVQGDYFHCNPKTRHAIPKNEMQIKNVERDKRKSKFVEEDKKYTLIELWEYDIINDIKKIKLCLMNLKK